MKLLLLFFMLSLSVFSDDFTFAVLKYQGGGDWYEGKVGAINLMEFINRESSIKCQLLPEVVEASDSTLYQFPFIYLTGHGNIFFSKSEVKHLKGYLTEGGFIYANDDYGMDESFKREMKKIFPGKKWVNLPSDHKLFNIYYPFPEGAPKIHKHDGGPPLTQALFHNGRIIVLYTKNTDIGDGWAPYQVHKDPEAVRRKALKFGLNIVVFSMTQ